LLLSVADLLSITFLRYRRLILVDIHCTQCRIYRDGL
jgi:hypothetical protein